MQLSSGQRQGSSDKERLYTAILIDTHNIHVQLTGLEVKCLHASYVYVVVKC